MKYKTPIIALAPIKYFDIHRKHNLAKILHYIRLAKKKKADIVCFPEACLINQGAVSLNYSLIKVIREECKKNSIWCIITEDMLFGKKKYNTSVLINRKGKICGHYKKINLSGESNLTLAGNKIKVFKTDFAKTGLAICWDLSFPEIFERMKKKGAEIIFCPAYWHYDEELHNRGHKKREVALLRAMILSRAFENLCFVALCNPLESLNKELVPYSAISSPNRILKDSFNKEGLLVAKLNLKEIHGFRRLYSKGE